jgi:hypothetical protein
MTGLNQLGALRFGDELSERGIPFWARYVLIPGHTDSARDIELFASWAASMPTLAGVELLPYHLYGKNKVRGGGGKAETGCEGGLGRAVVCGRLLPPIPCPPEAPLSDRPRARKTPSATLAFSTNTQWEALGLKYPLDGVATPPPSEVRRVIGTLEAAGLKVLCDAGGGGALSGAHTGAHS